MHSGSHGTVIIDITRKDLLPLAGALNFVTAAGDISTLTGSGVSRAYTHESHRTKTKGERGTDYFYSQGIARDNRLRNLIIL